MELKVIIFLLGIFLLLTIIAMIGSFIAFRNTAKGQFFALLWLISYLIILFTSFMNYYEFSLIRLLMAMIVITASISMMFLWFQHKIAAPVIVLLTILTDIFPEDLKKLDLDADRAEEMGTLILNLSKRFGVKEKQSA